MCRLDRVDADPSEGKEDIGRATSKAAVEPVDEQACGRPTVQVRHLFKRFGRVAAVDDLCFAMYESQIFALLGHNGAGKVLYYAPCLSTC
jgi:ABC-type polysaccharide/polyol phosphate transport system ATPase subunit